MDINDYLTSSCYSRDLAATRRIWADPSVMATSGAFIFLMYLASPALVAVRSGTGRLARSALDGERERAFLMRILGLTEQKAWQGGVANMRVLRQVERLYEHHSHFAGMKQEYLDFMGAVIALAPLRVRMTTETAPEAKDRVRYWRYIRYASSVMGAGFDRESDAEECCRRFAELHSGTSAEGAQLLRSLTLQHPHYVTRAIPLLFDHSRLVVERLLLGAS
jgi:hypothetical protein